MLGKCLPLVAVAATLHAAGCSREEPPSAPAEASENAGQEPKKSNVIKVETAVPYGKRVACADMLDLDEFARLTELDLGEMRDRGETNSAATSVCAFMRAGTPPADNAQLKRLEKENLKLGVLPGDEYCMITTYCSNIPPTPEEFEQTCRDRQDTLNEDLGFPACVHQTQRASEYAYTYKVVDPDTQCTIDVMGGPSVTDEDLVRRCTKATVELVTKASLAKYH